MEWPLVERAAPSPLDDPSFDGRLRHKTERCERPPAPGRLPHKSGVESGTRPLPKPHPAAISSTRHRFSLVGLGRKLVKPARSDVGNPKSEVPVTLRGPPRGGLLPDRLFLRPEGVVKTAVKSGRQNRAALDDPSATPRDGVCCALAPAHRCARRTRGARAACGALGWARGAQSQGARRSGEYAPAAPYIRVGW